MGYVESPHNCGGLLPMGSTGSLAVVDVGFKKKMDC